MRTAARGQSRWSAVANRLCMEQFMEVVLARSVPTMCGQLISSEQAGISSRGARKFFLFGRFWSPRLPRGAGPRMGVLDAKYLYAVGCGVGLASMARPSLRAGCPFFWAKTSLTDDSSMFQPWQNRDCGFEVLPTSARLTKTSWRGEQSSVLVRTPRYPCLGGLVGLLGERRNPREASPGGAKRRGEASARAPAFGAARALRDRL